MSPKAGSEGFCSGTSACGTTINFTYQVDDQDSPAKPISAVVSYWDSFGRTNPDPLDIDILGGYRTTCSPGQTNSGPCNKFTDTSGQFQEAALGACTPICISNGACISGGPSDVTQTWHIASATISSANINLLPEGLGEWTMSEHNLAKFIFLLILFVLSATPNSAERLPVGKELDAKLRESVASYELGPCTFPQALVQISNDFHVPMGIVWIDIEETQPRPPRKWQKSTVRDVIESTVRTQPGYRMEVTDDVAHIFPAELSGGRENFLTVKLKTFSVHDRYLEIASMKLHDLITPPSYAAGSVGANIEQKVTVDLKDCTVQDVLDALASASARRIWLVTFSKDPGLTPAGFRRSRSVWSSAPAPDKEQPVWDFLRWGDELPHDMSSTRR